MTQEVELRIHLKYCQFNGENVQEIKDLVGDRAYDEVGGARTYLVRSKARAKQIKRNYKKYHSTPF